jgi:hypothetical protein
MEGRGGRIAAAPNRGASDGKKLDSMPGKRDGKTFQ